MQRCVRPLGDEAGLTPDKVEEAVGNVQLELQTEGNPNNPYFVEKLEYWDTDMCHHANVAMREVRFCESLTRCPGRTCHMLGWNSALRKLCTLCTIGTGSCSGSGSLGICFALGCGCFGGLTCSRSCKRIV